MAHLSSTLQIRQFALMQRRMVSELGYADKAIYNSISLATSGDEVEAVRNSEVDSAIILAYNPTDSSVDGALKLWRREASLKEKGLIDLARGLGITNMLIDPGVMPLGSGAGSALRFSVVAKARLGLPVGSGIHNAVSAWPWLQRPGKADQKMLRCLCCCNAAPFRRRLPALRPN